MEAFTSCKCTVKVRYYMQCNLKLPHLPNALCQARPYGRACQQAQGTRQHGHNHKSFSGLCAVRLLLFSIIVLFLGLPDYCEVVLF